MDDKNLPLILDRLDMLYGTSKNGFYYKEDWQLLVAIMLSAQSTDKQVDEILPDLFAAYKTPADVINAPAAELEEAIRSVGLYKSKSRNMKKCCQTLLDKFNGHVPSTLDELLELAGVGRKTATLYLADMYDIPGVTVDTHVFRISKRLGWANGNNPATVEQELMKVLPKDHWIRINFQLIYLGREICTARKTFCDNCPLTEWCPKQIS